MTYTVMPQEGMQDDKAILMILRLNVRRYIMLVFCSKLVSYIPTRDQKPNRYGRPVVDMNVIVREDTKPLLPIYVW